jgi:hypothetical protein
MQSALRARSRLVERAGAAGSTQPVGEEMARRIARLDASIERISQRQRQRDETLRQRDACAARRAVVADAIAMRSLTDRMATSSRGAAVSR